MTHLLTSARDYEKRNCNNYSSSSQNDLNEFFKSYEDKNLENVEVKKNYIKGLCELCCQTKRDRITLLAQQLLIAHQSHYAYTNYASQAILSPERIEQLIRSEDNDSLFNLIYTTIMDLFKFTLFTYNKSEEEVTYYHCEQQTYQRAIQEKLESEIRKKVRELADPNRVIDLNKERQLVEALVSPPKLHEKNE